MPLHILTLNGGSSSIKFALFKDYTKVHCALQLVVKGAVERIGFSEALLKIERFDSKENFSRIVEASDYPAAVEIVIEEIKKQAEGGLLTVIGHRVVYGGARYYQPERVTSELLEELQRLSSFDPDHLPGEITLIKACQLHFPDLLQVACFDTAFHHTMPRMAQLMALPRRYEAQGIRRYGFHGLSCAFLMEELHRIAGEETAQGKVILAHLGNGASLTAVHHGKSVDTSMGFSPTSGVMMGTRSGDLDPSLITFLSQIEGMTPAQFQEMINKKSGLLGVSETSSDVRDLLAAEKEDPRAVEAIALFCYQIKKTIGSFAVALGGLETLVFAGGIGEQAPLIRKRICEGLGFLGIELNDTANGKNAELISSSASRVTVRVIATDEEVMIAKSVRDIATKNPTL